MASENDDVVVEMNGDDVSSSELLAEPLSTANNSVNAKLEDDANDMVDCDESAANMSDVQEEKKDSNDPVDDEEEDDENNEVARPDEENENENENNLDDEIDEEENKEVSDNDDVVETKMKQEDVFDDFVDDGDSHPSPNIDEVEFNTNETASTTVINGQGIWHSWTRNFSTPLLALLDLLDNAFDATTLSNRGRIYIQPDLVVQEDRVRKPRTTGLLLWNNSFTAIKPLHKVLEVYTSLKGSHADSIGENGVGLKQGCATLSNLSFCLVKSNSTQYSLGVIAYQLQTAHGCSLPAFTFESSNMDDLKNEMIEKFTTENSAVGECIIQYGAMDGRGQQTSNDGVGTSSKSSLLQHGIDRLMEKFQKMNQGGWENFPHIFCLVVDHLKHGEKVSSVISANEVDTSIDQQIRVNKLLETLYDDLPKRYLHIPTSLIDVRVGGQIVNFNYWQPRLVEMAQFDLKIQKSANMVDIFNARAAEKNKPPPKPKDDDDDDDDDGFPPEKVSSILDADPSQSYTLRIYTGFDALRVCDDRAQKTAAMYIYSRHSGRLIKANLDCRGELGLTSGGTDYCQGLTLIVDDHNAKFPLNPTKQDVAFGEQSNGETHKRNLYMWLNAALRMYYMFYKDRVCNKQKRVLTEALRMIEPKVYQLIQQSSTSFQSLSDCQFTSFGEFVTNCLMNNGQSIRLLPFKTVEYYMGKDSRLSLPAVPDNQFDEDYDRPKKKGKKSIVEKPRSPSKRPARRSVSVLSANDSDGDTNLEDDESIDDDVFLAKLTQKSKRRSYNESDDEIDLSQTKKHKRKRTISESKLSDSNKKSRKSGGPHRMVALEDENRQLKKEMHTEKRVQEGNFKKKQHQIEILVKEKSALQTEVSKQKVMIKQLQNHIKQMEKKNRSPSLPSDDISISRSSVTGGGDAKTLKRLKNLKSSFDVLKAENEDLKEQVKGLESTVKRKDDTIKAQRNVIDLRNKEDDEEGNFDDNDIEIDLDNDRDIDDNDNNGFDSESG